MKKVSLAILVSLSALTGAAYAQSDVEQRAQDLQAKQQAMESQQSMPMHHKMEHKKAPHHMKAAKPDAASQ
jgi:outer membrane lipoprotein-sorting protein